MSRAHNIHVNCRSNKLTSKLNERQSDFIFKLSLHLQNDGSKIRVIKVRTHDGLMQRRTDAVTEREETESRYSYRDVQYIATNGIVNTDTDRKQADGNTTLTSKHK